MPNPKATRLDLFDNSDYHPGNRITRALWLVVSGVFFQTWFPWPSKLKASWLRRFGAEIREGVVIKPRVTIKYPWKLAIGSHVWIGEQVWIDNLAQVSIGNHVCISQGALLLCGNHNYRKSTFDLITGAITVEDGVWIGAKSTVAPGVTCHTHSILAPGSAATSDLNEWTINQGNPATPKKTRFIED